MINDLDREVMPMSEHKNDNRQECLFRCENTFISCASSKYTGCVEALRVCKDKCPEN